MRLRDAFLQKLNRVDEAALAYRHDHINGVEVLPAVKTSGKIGFLMGGCVKALAQRTAEPQYPADISQL
jgi:hypothetical protein